MTFSLSFEKSLFLPSHIRSLVGSAYPHDPVLFRAQFLAQAIVYRVTLGFPSFFAADLLRATRSQLKYGQRL